MLSIFLRAIPHQFQYKSANKRILFIQKVYNISFLPVLTPADAENHIDKQQFTVPFVCGARNLGEALRRIAEGAAMIRTKGEAGTGRNYNRGKNSECE